MAAGRPIGAAAVSTITTPHTSRAAPRSTITAILADTIAAFMNTPDGAFLRTSIQEPHAPVLLVELKNIGLDPAHVRRLMPQLAPKRSIPKLMPRKPTPKHTQHKRTLR